MDAPPVEVETRALANLGRYSNDNVVCSLRFANGSQGTILYLANGDKSYSKERIEVFGGGSVAVLEDFRRLELARSGKKKIVRSLLRQDKGHRGEWQSFLAAIQAGADSPIPFPEIVSTMMATFALEESRCLGRPITVKQIDHRDRAMHSNGFDQAS
jgi:predicted dehydrogenase